MPLPCSIARCATSVTDVPSEEIGQPLTLAQARDHLVHRGLQHSEVTGSVDRQLDVEPAVLHGLQRAPHIGNRLADRLRVAERDDEACNQARDRQYRDCRTDVGADRGAATRQG